MAKKEIKVVADSTAPVAEEAVPITQVPPVNEDGFNITV
jgi:hypothetical protein